MSLNAFRLVITACFLIFLYAGCNNSGSDANIPEEEEAGSPVTVVHPEVGPIAETVTVNAVSDFLVRTPIRSTVNGYLVSVKVRPGDLVHRGDMLFTMETKESRNLGNVVSRLDSSLHFQGRVSLYAPLTGYVTSLQEQEGGFLQEGDPLATVADSRSFVFLLDLPYELSPIIRQNRDLELHLADGRTLAGKLGKAMPSVDSVSQTQRYIINVPDVPPLPSNLIATLSLVKTSRPMSTTLPKAAVLSDEVQDHFWIMQALDSTTAVRIDVTRGIEAADRIEIVTPHLSPEALILVTGNYGLPDTAKINIVH